MAKEKPVASIALVQTPPVPYGSVIDFAVMAPDPPGKSQQEISVAAFVDLNDGKGPQQVYLDVHVANSPLQPWTEFTLASDTWANAPFNKAPAQVQVELFYYTWKGQQETGVVHEASTSFTTS
jgi:hypothetical protein